MPNSSCIWRILIITENIFLVGVDRKKFRFGSLPTQNLPRRSFEKKAESRSSSSSQIEKRESERALIKHTRKLIMGDQQRQALSALLEEAIRIVGMGPSTQTTANSDIIRYERFVNFC